MKENARSAALNALERCEKNGAWSGAAVDAAIQANRLDARDAALASRLCLGVLQNSSYLDFYLDQFCSRKLEPRVRNILRLGVYQLLFLDKIPDHAAVDETVSLCREGGQERASGLVNAVLRRIADRKKELPPIPDPGTTSYLATRWSHPQWLVDRLLRQHDFPFVEAFLQANNSPAPLTIQINRLRVSPAEYQRALERAEISFRIFAELPGCFELEGGRVTELPGYEEGLFYVQDRAARTAVEAAGVRPGMRILDACAAPGGKSFAAAIAGGNACSLISCDIHEKKLRLIRSGAERLGIQGLNAEARDARTAVPEWNAAFDLVLADVPCSGLGVIRKHPEIRWKKEDELAALPRIQADILDNLSAYVKPGGVLLYSTCTVLREENRDQIDRFLAAHPDYHAEDFTVGAISSTGGCYDFWPQQDGTDGFFAAKLRRKDG